MSACRLKYLPCVDWRLRSIARPWDADMCQRLTALYQTIRRPDYRALEINLQTHSTQHMSRFVVDAKTMTLKNMTTGESRALRCTATSTLLDFFFHLFFRHPPALHSRTVRCSLCWWPRLLHAG